MNDVNEMHSFEHHQGNIVGVEIEFAAQRGSDRATFTDKEGNIGSGLVAETKAIVIREASLEGRAQTKTLALIVGTT